VADGHLGIWAALREVWPAVLEQGCWNHKLVNVLDQLPEKVQAEARALLTQIPYTRRSSSRPSPAGQRCVDGQFVSTRRAVA